MNTKDALKAALKAAFNLDLSVYNEGYFCNTAMSALMAACASIRFCCAAISNTECNVNLR
jgi:hypothetical protein